MERFRVQECGGKFRVQKDLGQRENIVNIVNRPWWRLRPMVKKPDGSKWVSSWISWFSWCGNDDDGWNVKDLPAVNDFFCEEVIFDTRQEALDNIEYFYGQKYTLESPEWRTV